MEAVCVLERKVSTDPQQQSFFAVSENYFRPEAWAEYYFGLLVLWSTGAQATTPVFLARLILRQAGVRYVCVRGGYF